MCGKNAEKCKKFKNEHKFQNVSECQNKLNSKEQNALINCDLKRVPVGITKILVIHMHNFGSIFNVE